jgi:hypothetical protein
MPDVDVGVLVATRVAKPHAVAEAAARRRRPAGTGG